MSTSRESASGHEHRFRDVCDKSGLAPDSGHVAALQRNVVQGQIRTWSIRRRCLSRVNFIVIMVSKFEGSKLTELVFRQIDVFTCRDPQVANETSLHE